VEKLHAAERLRAHAISIEMVHAHLQDPDWLSDEVARKAIENVGLAKQVMDLQREREAVEGARRDVSEFTRPGQPSAARDLVQMLVGQNRHTILMPLKHAVAAIRAAVDCWGQEVVEKANALKES
jgi:coenzyme F420-reducing hydrogenase alpha subunit